MSYYDRPNMVKNALNSILINNKIYKNWEFIFVDDGSKNIGRPIVEDVLKDHLHKVKFYNTNDTIENKFKGGGIMSGRFFNEAIKESNAELGIYLADDDILYEDYLFNLNEWFNKNPYEPYCCSDLIWFVYGEEIPNKNIIQKYGNNFSGWSAPRYRLERHQEGCGTDISDMSWKISCNKEGNIWFQYPDLVFLDSFKVNLWKKYGEPAIGTEIRKTKISNFYACYKSRHINQLTKKIREHNYNYNVKSHYMVEDNYYSGMSVNID